MICQAHCYRNREESYASECFFFLPKILFQSDRLYTTHGDKEFGTTFTGPPLFVKKVNEALTSMILAYVL